MASAQWIPNTAYTVGWISAIPTEHTAASLFLDEEHPATDVSPRDENDYTLGRIGRHNVVIAVLPHGEYGIASAASVATSMLSSFPNIRIGLMVGIGGGAPSPKHDIRLGDIVVSASYNGNGGIFQYEFGKTIQNQSFHTNGIANQPPSILRAAVSGLISQYERNEGHNLQKAIDKALENKKKLQKKYGRPDSESDKLYRSDVIHPTNNDASCATFCGNDSSKLVLRPVRPEDEDIIQIHYGIIASADKLMKDALIRDRLSEEKDVLCFDMEAAGLMNRFPCLVIRGICDYSDTHKNKQWQGYAAMAAAAYAKDVLNRIAPNKVEVERKLGELLIDIRKDIHNIQDHATDTKTRVKELQADGHLDKFRNWLSPPDPSTNFTKAREQHHNGTGQWLLHSNVYLKWKTERNSFLWLNGIPGCGKTILSSSVIEDIKQCAASSQNLVYFYFDFNDTRKQSLETAVRSLIFQLYKQKRIQKEADALYSSCNNGYSQPCKESLCTLFQSMIHHDSEFWIVLDALDECKIREEGSANGLLPWIKSLRDLNADLHILVTSRPEQDIKSAIEKWALDNEIISLQSGLVEKDINAYIKAKTKQMRRWQTRPDVQDDIETALSQKADGMFRWVSCQFDVLNECFDPPSVRKELANLPRTLDATYERILQNVKPEHVNYTKRLLQFLVYSDRPLRLEEAVDAVTVDISQQPRFDPANRMPIPDEIVRYCSSLVILVKRESMRFGTETEEIQLAHFSVQEYLMSDRLKGDMAKDLEKTTASTAILEVCLSYLLDLEYPCHSIEATKRYPMAQYSAQYWPRHAAIIEQSTKSSINIVEDYLFSTQAFEFGYRLYQPDQTGIIKISSFYPEYSVNALYYTSAVGLLYSARKLVEMGANVNAQSGSYGNALQAAIMGRYQEVAQMLLDNGADVNAQGRKYSTALQAASMMGHQEVVQMLLDNGANVNAENVDYRTALHAASAGGHHEVAQILLDSGADINAQCGRDDTALRAASARGHQEVVQILLDNGADVNAQGEYYGTSLMAASERGYQGVVQILLANGANVNARGKVGTALQYASSGGHQEVVQMLLDNGADINAQGVYYGTALMAASIMGHQEVVQMLLDNGADVNAKGISGTALLIASSGGYQEVVQMLLDNGADVNAEGGTDGSALQAASMHGYKEVVQMLLDNGADVNVQGGIYGTALQAALAGGYQEVAQMLLDKGREEDTERVVEILPVFQKHA